MHMGERRERDTFHGKQAKGRVRKRARRDNNSLSGRVTEGAEVDKGNVRDKV